MAKSNQIHPCPLRFNGCRVGSNTHLTCVPPEHNVKFWCSSWTQPIQPAQTHSIATSRSNQTIKGLHLVFSQNEQKVNMNCLRQLNFHLELDNQLMAVFCVFSPNFLFLLLTPCIQYSYCCLLIFLCIYLFFLKWLLQVTLLL